MQDGCSPCSVPSLNLAPLPGSSLYWTLRKRIPPSSPISTGEIQLLLFRASQAAVSPHDKEFRQVLTTSLKLDKKERMSPWAHRTPPGDGFASHCTCHLTSKASCLFPTPYNLQTLVIHWVIRINANSKPMSRLWQVWVPPIF